MFEISEKSNLYLVGMAPSNVLTWKKHAWTKRKRYRRLGVKVARGSTFVFHQQSKPSRLRWGLFIQRRPTPMSINSAVLDGVIYTQQQPIWPQQATSPKAPPRAAAAWQKRVHSFYEVVLQFNKFHKVSLLTILSNNFCWKYLKKW